MPKGNGRQARRRVGRPKPDLKTAAHAASVEARPLEEPVDVETASLAAEAATPDAGAHNGERARDATSDHDPIDGASPLGGVEAIQRAMWTMFSANAEAGLASLAAMANARSFEQALAAQTRIGAEVLTNTARELRIAVDEASRMLAPGPLKRDDAA